MTLHHINNIEHVRRNSIDFVMFNNKSRLFFLLIERFFISINLVLSNICFANMKFYLYTKKRD